MKVYVFGNPDYAPDSLSFAVMNTLKVHFDGVDWEIIKPNADVPFVGVDHVVILDAVDGIHKMTLITEENIDKIELGSRSTVHDFDLGFQLKYLKKLGKLKKFTVIGLPMSGEIDYDSIQLTLRKLVAQDIHGS